MACWKVGTEDLIASLLLLLELESESESVDGECCGILVEEKEVLIAETAKWRRKRWWWLRLAMRRRERPEVWGLRKEMTRQAWRVRLSQLGFIGGTFCNLK